MALTIARIQTRLMKEYYQFFSKYSRGKEPDKKIAWVTAFTPVEILEALGIAYYYPESYAAVIAASGKEGELLDKSEELSLSRDCCSYSCCFEGCLELSEGPRGVPPKPDILIATNNQCNTLPAWWNIIAQRYDVPIIILDYPGETAGRDIALDYVTRQHKDLISRLELLSGNKVDYDVLARLIENSVKSVEAWKRISGSLKTKDIKATTLFDDISFLITARCKADTSEMYKMMGDAILEKEDADSSAIPVFWLGYPLWYHQDRYLSEAMDGFRIVGSNYITWWSLDYSGGDSFERLFSAYNYTFLNLCQGHRNERLGELVRESGAVCAITLHNKSCKCDFVSARDISIPQAELEIDMIDRKFLNVEKAKGQIEILKESL